MNPLDILDGGSAHRKASTYSGQPNTEKSGHIFPSMLRSSKWSLEALTL